MYQNYSYAVVIKYSYALMGKELSQHKEVFGRIAALGRLKNHVSRIFQKQSTVIFCNMIYTTLLFQGGRHLGREASFTQDARQRSFKSKGLYVFGDKLKFRETRKMVTQIGGYFHNY